MNIKQLINDFLAEDESNELSDFHIEYTAEIVEYAIDELSRAFERRTRNNGDEFVCLGDGRPDWMQELAHEVHGDMLPDDWKYELFERAVDGYNDESYESDVYNSRLLSWASSNLTRPAYVDEAVENYGYPNDHIKAIVMGQMAEMDDIYKRIEEWLEDGDNLSSDNESVELE